MAFAFVSMNVWTEVGSVLQRAVDLTTTAGQSISTVTHAVVGGALSVAQGGSFLEGSPPVHPACAETWRWNGGIPDRHSTRRFSDIIDPSMPSEGSAQ